MLTVNSRDTVSERFERCVVVSSIVNLKGADLVLNVVIGNDLLEHIRLFNSVVALKDLHG